MNKRGATDVFFGVLIFLVTTAIVLIILDYKGIYLPTTTTNRVINTIWDSLVQLKDIVWNVAVPSGLNENQQMIAFAVFLLLVIISTRALKNFFRSPILAFVIAFLVGLIAARGLNATIIDKYVVGSPVASGAFLVGILPILMFYGFMNKWTTGRYLTKFLVWMLFAVVYAFVFHFGFESTSMGLAYFAGIAIAGAIETFGPLTLALRVRERNLSLGRFMAMTHTDLEAFRTAQEGAGMTPPARP